MHTFPALHIPHEQFSDVFLPLGTTARGQLRPIGAPGHIIEECVGIVGVPHELPTGSCDRVPQADGIVPPATGQPPSIRTPFHSFHGSAMAAQQPGWSDALRIPDGHQHIRACTGKLRAIGTPGHRVYPVRVSHKCLGHASTRHLPELDGAVPAPTGQPAAIGGKGQGEHPAGMPCEDCNAARGPALLYLPQPNLSLEAATGKQALIGTPGDLRDCAARS
jgi:hypothetical protein